MENRKAGDISRGSVPSTEPDETHQKEKCSSNLSLETKLKFPPFPIIN